MLFEQNMQLALQTDDIGSWFELPSDRVSCKYLLKIILLLSSDIWISKHKVFGEQGYIFN